MIEPVFLPYQQRLGADRSQIILVEKSRRIGYSWALAALCVIDAARSAGLDTWYVGYNKDMTQEYIRDCAWWARQLGQAVSAISTERVLEDEDKDILTYSIHFASGHRIVALSSRPSNMRNKKGRIVIDEAAFHDDLKELLKAALAIKMWGGKVVILSTHNGVENYFNTLVEEVLAEKRPYSHHRVTLDDALRDGFYRRVCLTLGEEWSQEKEDEWRKTLIAEYGDDAQEELFCVPSRSGGTYISRALIEQRMVQGDVLRLNLGEGFVDKPVKDREAYVRQWCESVVLPHLNRLPADRPHFFGEDFGRTADRTVIAVGYLRQNLDRVAPLAVELLNVPYEQQGQVLFFVVDRLPRFMHGALDGSGNGGYLAEVASQRYGVSRISKITIAERFYAENFPKLKAAFEGATLQIPKDADHLIDLTHVKRINGVPKIPKAKTAANGEGPPRHGDAAVAYLMWYYASSQPIPDYTYQGVRGRHASAIDDQPMTRRGGIL